jgi:hypothetical protein
MNSTLSSACIWRRAGRGSGRGEGVPAVVEAAADTTAAGSASSSSSSSRSSSWLGESDQRWRSALCEPLVLRERRTRARAVALLLLPARCAREVEARAASGMLAAGGWVAERSAGEAQRRRWRKMLC